MKKIEVFDGNALLDKPAPYQAQQPVCAFFGVAQDGKQYQVPLDANLLSRHMLFLGGIGTGKTNAFLQILPQIRRSMSATDVMVIFDAKGDFYNALYRPGDIVISNDETATGPDGSNFWNIFGEIEKGGAMEENIVEISKMLFAEKLERAQQPFFPNAAKDLFGATLTHFIRTGLPANNKTLKDFFDSTPSDGLREMIKSHPDMRAMVSYIADDRSPQTQGVLSELQQQCREVFIGNFKKEGSLSMRELVRAKGGRVIFVEYDLGIGNMLSPVYSLMFDMAIKEALSRRKSEGNVYFIADEFRLLPNLEHIDDAVNFGRSLGVKFMIGFQNVEQIYECYGEQRARSILSGFLTSLSFRVTDATSKQFIKDLHGLNRKKEIYMASVQGRGIVENIRDAYVIEDWDIANLRIGEAVVGLPGYPPFLFRLNPV